MAGRGLGEVQRLQQRVLVTERHFTQQHQPWVQRRRPGNITEPDTSKSVVFCQAIMSTLGGNGAEAKHGNGVAANCQTQVRPE